MKLDPKELKPWTVYRLFEGGGVYTAERDGLYFVIVDESSCSGCCRMSIWVRW